MRAELCLMLGGIALVACAPVTPAVRPTGFADPATGTHIVRQLAREAPPGAVRVPAGALPSIPALSGNAAAANDAHASGGGAAGGSDPPEPLSPFDDSSSVIFTVAGQHFSRGERVIVTVCLAADHSIASADIFESSGDSRFDALALVWARRIRLRASSPGEQVAPCGAVRVEVRPSQEPRVFSGSGDAPA